jgi:hypothetical protein
MNEAFAAIGLAAFVVANANAQLNAPRWQITRELTIGGNAAGDAELDVVTGITVGPDGAVYVMQPTQSLFRVFESDGQFRGRLGQRGAGPGEFRNIGAYGWIGDTLWVTDLAQRRIVWFDAKGRHLRTVPDPASAGPERVNVLAPLSNGRVLTQQGYPDIGEITAKLAIQPASGGASRPVVEHRLVSEVLEIQRGVYIRNTFADNPVVSVCPGSARFDVVDSRAPAVDSASYRIRRFSAEGTPLGPGVSGTIKPRLMPSGHVDSVQRSYARGYIRTGVISESDYLDIVHRAIPQRRFHRVFDSAVCARNGDLWLHLAGDRPLWVILDASNVFKASVELPPNSQLGYATGDRVWVIQRDELDVPSIVRYKLERPKLP